jgi:hypothetical protein
MTSKQFSAYQLINKDDKVEGTVWWDGHYLRASEPEFLKRIKNTRIPVSFEGTGVPEVSDGELFFDCLPLAFRNGFSYLKSIKVDENGKEV